MCVFKILHLNKISIFAVYFQGRADSSSVSEIYLRHDIFQPKRIKDASTIRKLDYVLGRLAAKNALHSLGIVEFFVDTQVTGAPMWPSHVTGSISHFVEDTGGVGIACAIKSTSARGVGIDVLSISPDKKIYNAIYNVILNSAEQNLVAKSDNKSLLSQIVFSAKESIYKAFSNEQSNNDCIQPRYEDFLFMGIDWKHGILTFNIPCSYFVNDKSNIYVIFKIIDNTIFTVCRLECF